MHEEHTPERQQSRVLKRTEKNAVQMPAMRFLLSRQILHTWVGILCPANQQDEALSDLMFRCVAASDLTPLRCGLLKSTSDSGTHALLPKDLLVILPGAAARRAWACVQQQKCLMSRERAFRSHAFLNAYPGPPTKMACRSQVTDLPFLHPSNSKRADANESRVVLQQIAI